MSTLKDTRDVVEGELIPLLDELCRLTDTPAARDQYAFFSGIREGLRRVNEPDDMAGPFMELSTSAFRGFLFAPETALVLDHALALAQSLSMALSASSDELQ